MTMATFFPVAIVNAAASAAAFDVVGEINVAKATLVSRGLTPAEHRKVQDGVSLATRLARAAERGHR